VEGIRLPGRRREHRTSDSGFSLVELVIVMIIIGVLAAIAIPVFLSQRSKARDTSTESDVSILGKEVAAYFVDGKGTLTLNFTLQPGHIVVSDGTYVATMNLSTGTAAPAAGGSSNLNDPKTWCVSLTDANGQNKDYKYSATNGLTTGTCP
jgi:type IV pilus assembly protein PilA